MRYAMVLDNRGRVLAHSDPTQLGEYSTDLEPQAVATVLTVFRREVELVDIASPIMLDGHQMGWVRVGLAGDDMKVRLVQIRRNGIVYTLLAVALTMALAYLTSRYMTRRLRSIEHVANAVQAGNTALRANVSGHDEAAQLARQFNDVLDTLASRDRALKDSKAFKNIILDSVAAEVVVLPRPASRAGSRWWSCRSGQMPKVVWPSPTQTSPQSWIPSSMSSFMAAFWN